MTERSRTRALVAAGALFFALGILILAWNIPLPLIAYSPGPVMDVVDAVVVEEGPVHPTRGELLQLTVAGQDINAFEAVVAAVDPAVDVLARSLVRRPEESDEDYRRRNLQMMDQSTATAISVALEHVEVGEETKVFITGYAADTPAGEVLEIGDRIVSLGGEAVKSTAGLSEIMEGLAPGEEVEVEVERDGEVRRHEVRLVAHEESAERPMIGIFVRDLPFWIEVRSGTVGGPSAGMMYTLGIVDVLTPGSLTNGAVVAGTGTVDEEGNVGNIGGVRQKVVASEAAGADYMLVPAGNYEAALTAEAGDMQLVSISTVGEALEFLAGLADG